MVDLTRDQQRAAIAYRKAEEANRDKATREHYKVLVNGLGTNVMRSGLAATMSWLERQRKSRERALQIVLEALLEAKIAGIPATTEDRKSVSQDNLAAVIRNRPLDDYMLATRDVMRIALWLKRAAQAVLD